MLKSFLSVLLLVWGFAVQAKPLTEVVVFGDSLSDNGNLYEFMGHQLPLSPPYFQGRFTNGPVWIELLMEKLYPSNGADRLKDYAFGGAGISLDESNEDTSFSLQQQIQNYLDENQNIANPEALYVIWMGANNYFNLPENPEETIRNVNQVIERSISKLVKIGARNFLLINIPDLSRTPAAIEFEAGTELQYMSLEHNRQFAEVVRRMKARYTRVRFAFYDVTKVMGDIVDNPQKHGFIDATHTCYEHLMNANIQDAVVKKSRFLSNISSIAYPQAMDNCEGYLFFDLYHPSERAHQIMADEIYKLLENEGFNFNA
ncbi:MAG: lysophospholipase [Gammaproteobacteria bacterium]|nr:lysophospholipase [Gammaproteobacteria bacterium]